MTEIRGASNAKANRELAWNPAHPSWREGFRGIDEQGRHDRVRHPGRQQVDRRPDRLVNQEVRLHSPPLPHHRNPGRKPHPPLAAALILAPAAGVAVQVSHPLCVTFIKGKNLSSDEGGRPARRRGRAVRPGGEEPAALFLAVTVTAAGGHVRLGFNCVCQVMPVLHQMEFALVKARCV